ncbi:inositol monophosphatase family protein [Phormidium sp. FACHB-1136]|uniref:inositol monophosphatase family protein n=1 Tax=Phormidium sp. FACHB-1136 TaxID=2692848 RepID=UPI0018EF5499|nr:inositol monophosphatase family protein [Phormidium sp. FACHB-1136]
MSYAMNAFLVDATAAARAAAAVILRKADQLSSLTIMSKGLNDFVSEVDHDAEREIVKILSQAYPGHSFLCEEAGYQGCCDSEFTWIIDPLDGTTNFLHGFPQFAVSIALLNFGCLECGVIYDPTRDELFTAVRGGGAALNGRPMRVTEKSGLAGSLLCTGFPLWYPSDNSTYFDMMRTIVAEGANIRRCGAAALDLAWVACGRIDGFWEMGLKPWDIAAGILLIQEAGGIVTDFAGGGSSLETGDILTAGPTLQTQMYEAFFPYADQLPIRRP